MLKNENIICISSIDWDFIWQGHQEIMSVFARNGNRVLFIENTGVRMPGLKDAGRIKSRIKNWLKGFKGIRKEADNLYIFSPLILPFPYARIARIVNRHMLMSTMCKWMNVVDFSDPIVWTFLPTPLSSDISGSFIKKLCVYYCIDNFSVSSSAAKKIRASEAKLLKTADLVFVTSKELYNHCGKYADNIHIFPFGVNFAEFEKARISELSSPEELKNVKKPVIGYVGGVHKWIDMGLVKYLAQRFPEYSFVFAGPVQTDISLLSCLKNIYFLGSKKHNDLPALIKNFDICVIPYLITDYTRNVYPTKLNEYLAMAKPVISTRLPEVEEFSKKYPDSVYVADNFEAFGNYISSVREDSLPGAQALRIEAARQNSWESRIEKMSGLIEEQMRKKRLNEDVRWKENLLYFYGMARRRVLKLILVCLLVFMVLFKTPFIWFVASPLKISQPPQKADVIVVFGGGVGETGSPGKSTIERAIFASKLYKDGYADKILFSSGYTYVYNDAQNMKLLAVSKGVPQAGIILEQKANSTYENVIFSKEALSRLKCGSIILVSSEYNMRRASLVINKYMKDLKVYYVPVDKSQFYDRAYGVNMEQIKAIIHEYLAIAYYSIKKYI